MIELPGYVIQTKILENDKTVIYKGHKTNENIPVIIKTIRKKEVSPAAISGLVNECEITRNLNIQGIVKPVGLERTEDSFALIMEDTGAIPLRGYMKNTPLDLPAFLEIAVQLAETLGELHQNGIVHMNLKAENILYHPDTGIAKIMDFSKAAALSPKSERGAVLNTMPESNGYMPSEQPGVGAGAADCRRDYYALGAVFYEMLTGQALPLLENSAPWRCDGLTGEADSQGESSGKSHPALFPIIMKLLSPNPDEGYQSAYGLIKDLEECKRQWNLTGDIKPFTPGRMDASSRFLLPNRLYGRKAEAEDLKAAFERACTGEGEFILVSGYAGIGKTMLVNEVLKPIAMRRGYFAYGKFDQLRQNIPYAPFAAALGSVIRQIMTESSGQLEAWRRKIRRALGSSGSVIAELIPELKMLIGPQPPVEALQPTEAQNRFHMTFGNFIKVFAEKGHPLTVFLDDLQWADLSSLEFIRHLCRITGLNHMLLVGAYRDNEVAAEHPLTVTVKKIRNDGSKVRGIRLTQLNHGEVREYIAEALHCPGDKVDELAETLYRKTYGIPFFLGQLLKSVYNAQLLRFNVKNGCWEWNGEAIREMQMPDGVGGFILEKLQRFPQETLAVLKLASCVGNSFDLGTLCAVCQKTRAETASILVPVVLEGLLLPVSPGKEGSPAASRNTVPDTFEFLHDTVRQAVYSLLSEEERKEAHVRVGRLILQKAGADEIDGKILSVLDHINRGLDLIDDPAERLKLAEYNLAAGRKAKAAAAYDPALSYYKAGMGLLPADSWESCYHLSRALYLERAQCEYLMGDAAVAEELFQTAVRRMGTELERADVYDLKMLLYAGTGKWDEALQIGLNALKNLGMKLPANPGMTDYARELLSYKWRMRNRSIEDLAKLPEMKDPVQRKIAQLLISFIFVTCTSRPDLYSFTILKAGNHALKYGNTDIASIGYIGYAITEGSVLGNYADGYELGKVAISLVERYDRTLPKCIVYFTMGSLIIHWTRHWEEGLQYLYKAVKLAVETGNVLMVGYCYGVILESRYLMGTALAEVLEEARKYNSYARRMKHKNLGINATVYERLVSALANPTGRASSECGDDFDEEAFIQSAIDDKPSLAAYYFSKIQLCYMFGDYHGALSAVEEMKNCEDAIKGFMLTTEYTFYHSLAIAAVYKKLGGKSRKGFMKTLKKNSKTMKKWSDSCPENFLHKYLLMEAEKCRILDRKQEAGELYDKAIRFAHENGYVHMEALACELAGSFYTAQGRERIARVYISEAFRLYRRWGAEAKAQDLKCQYPDLLDGVEEKREKEAVNPVDILKEILLFPGIAGRGAPGVAGVSGFQNEIQDITERSDPGRLLDDFLELAVRSAGADRGFIILENNDELFIEARRDYKNGRSTAEKPVSLEKSGNLSKLVVRYVARTLEPVVLNDSSQAGIFVRDPYIAKSGVKSIACFPLQLKGIPVGVLYLENSLAAGVFTKERVELLKILADQMILAKAMQAFLEQSGFKAREGVGSSPAEQLTKRELEVLTLMAAGLQNKEIARRLDTTVNTVKTHIRNIYGKLQVNRRVQAVAKAKELHLL